ncbi:MAG: MFS transporter [Pseudomonadota bacterium]
MICPPTRRQLFSYGQLALPLAIAGLPLYLHAPAYYASHQGLSLGTLGILLLSIRAIDALQDPLIGHFSDRYHAHRQILIAVGLLLLGSGIWLVFHPGDIHPAAWLAVSLLISTTGYSIVSINLQSLGSLWIAPQTHRTRIHTWRESIGLIGVLLAAAAPTLLGNTDQPHQAYHYYTLLSLPLLLVAGLMFRHWQRHTRQHQPATTVTTNYPWQMLQASRWHRRYYSLYFGNSLAGAIPAVLVLYYIQDRLQADSYSGYYLALYFLSGALGMPVWQMLARRYGNLYSWQISILLAAVTFIGAYQLDAGDYLAYGLICLLSGLALGADLALPPAILAERIHQQREYADASRYYALLTLLNKSALALAAGIALPLLAQLGYQPGYTDPTTTQALSIVYALLPSGLKLIIAGMLWHHLTTQETTS